MAGEPDPSESSSLHEIIFSVGIVVLILLAGAMAVWYFSDEPASPLPVDYQLKVNINTADVEVITLLPGVGDALAGRIVEARQTGGPFADLQELQKRVSGLGPAKTEQLGAYLLFESEDTSPRPLPSAPEPEPDKTPESR